MAAEALFLPTSDGQRFCLYHPAERASGQVSRGLVVYVHPFAEEMNKSRRMVARQARELSVAGFDVLQLDLLGCGDSSGDFGDATWQAWVDDVAVACRWLRNRAASDRAGELSPPLWLWGLRAGCLLAVQAAQTLDGPCHFLFWSPTPSGKPLLQQFLRLKAASDMAGNGAKTVMEGLRSRLAQGQPVEVAGYVIAPALASGLEQATLSPPGHALPGVRVEWFELSTRPDASFTPAAVKAIAGWEEHGYAVSSRMANGPSFWQTTEIEDAPMLISATTAALVGLDSP